MEEQREVRVTTEDVVAGVRRMSNWKAQGRDGVRKLFQEIVLHAPGHGEEFAGVLG